MDTEVPTDVMTFGPQIAPAAAFFDAAFVDAAVEGNMAAFAEVEFLRRNIDDEGSRRCVIRESGGPNLKVAAIGKGCGGFGLLHEQISKPPGAAAVGEAAANEPNFVAAAHVGGGVDGVEGGVVGGWGHWQW